MRQSSIVVPALVLISSAVALVGAGGCKSTTQAGGCDPGYRKDCLGDDRCVGESVCAEDGTWGECSCGGGEGGSGAGASSGTTGGNDSGTDGAPRAGAAGGGAGSILASAGGASGDGGSAGRVPAGGAGAECGDIQYIGACDGDTYVWCDYFTGRLRTLDCHALGLTCEFNPVMPPEDFINGCVGALPNAQMPTCDGHLILRTRGGLLVQDCEQIGGPGSACREIHDEQEDEHYAHCEKTTPCSPASSASCDGDFLRVCNEEGTLGVTSCAAKGVTCGAHSSTELGFCCIRGDGACY